MNTPEYLKKKTDDSVVETFEDEDFSVENREYITDPVTGLTFEVVKYKKNNQQSVDKD